MVKLIYSEHSLLCSHVKLAEVGNKSGEEECLKEKIQFFFHKSNYGGLVGVFFAFLFLAKGELIFAFRSRLLGHLSGPIFPPGTGEEQKSG